jgi:hypothetical protein
MLVREIKYDNFDGEEETGKYYFHMTRTEWIELNAEYEGGLDGAFKRLSETKDLKGIITLLRTIILKSYGIKSDDGKRFIKNDKVREDFTQEPAYDVLFMDLATNEDAGLNFIRGLMPKDLLPELDKEIAKAKTAAALSVVEPKE